MAPEVMLSQGYDMSADYWAFGVLVYEMLAGYAPFQAKTDSQRHRRILTADLRFKDGFQLRAKDLVSKLCVVDTSRRLGMLSGGVDDIKRHAFFHEHGKADWAARARREATPPLMPVIRRAEDMTRGDALKSVARATAAEAPSPASDRVFGEYF
jgi:serine/threonine protein kinase